MKREISFQSGFLFDIMLIEYARISQVIHTQYPYVTKKVR